jgi:hypothetical protein
MKSSGKSDRRFRMVVLLLLAWTATPAAGQVPKPGQVERLKVITISLSVGSTEKEVKQVTYSPPPGWYVRSHSVDCTSKRGNSSFAVNTVPQNWSWLSEEKVSETWKVLIDLAGKAHGADLQAKFSMERDALLSQLRQARSSHHALVVDATARGEGFLRGGGGIELTVTAEMVYVGTEEQMRKTIEQHRAKLK